MQTVAQFNVEYRQCLDSLGHLASPHPDGAADKRSRYSVPARSGPLPLHSVKDALALSNS
jgi:hypothetical protein